MKRTHVIGSVADDFAEEQKTLKKNEKKKTKQEEALFTFAKAAHSLTSIYV